MEDIRYLYIKLNLFALYSENNSPENIVYTEIDKKDWNADLQLKYSFSNLNEFPLDNNLAIRRYFTICYDRNNPSIMGIALQSYYDKNHNKKVAREIALKRLKEQPIQLRYDENKKIVISDVKKQEINECELVFLNSDSVIVSLKNIYDILIELESDNLIYSTFKDFMCHKYKKLIIKVVEPRHYDNG